MSDVILQTAVIDASVGQLSETDATVSHVVNITAEVTDANATGATVSNVTSVTASVVDQEPMTATVGGQTQVSATVQLGLTPLDTRIAELRGTFKFGQNDYYTEPTVVAGEITKLEKWRDALKAVKLMTRTITWSGGLPVGMVTVDEITGATLTTTLTWSAGELADITETVTA